MTRDGSPVLYVSAIVSFDEHASVLVVCGDEDRATQGRRRPSMSRALVASARDITVDLSELSFADSSLMLDLAMLARRLRKRGRTMRLHGAPPHIHRLIEMVGLDRLPGVLLASPAS